MSLAGTAKETLAIVERGSYTAPSGKTVELRALIDAAVGGTILYRPDHPLDPPSHSQRREMARCEVTAETTAQAARRLFEEGQRVVALNFASAKNPGGGFLGGAKAQEEDLARCSALYTCQLTQRGYYEANRATASMLYTDHLIYSPEVPFFRDERLALLEKPFLASVITAPAPNAGEALRRDAHARPEIRAVLERRAGKLLAVAAEKQHDCLVLGAWGCGVFRNDPDEVAEVFHGWLSRFNFTRVVFAIYDRSSEKKTLSAFQRRFSS